MKFYVEAKKPHADIATTENYFQINRYGWSRQTPVGVLHDFEQFQIADCRYKPDLATALSGSIRKYHFSQYENAEKFAEIYWLFSREAVAGGSLEKFAETLPKRRGKAGRGRLFRGGDQNVDESFLGDLDGYRDTLARAFKNSNPGLDGETLTELTQRTLDRLVFLRFLEDKHIEPENRIAYFGDKRTAWQDFIAESRRLDGIYNGIVFKAHAILDAPSFKVDGDAFSDICKSLSHIESSYDFNSVPIHILGSIYERFLGKVIVATEKRARVEEKPEVRKAGGVYYTPEYIVRYIVENTVGKLIEGKTPAQIAGMKHDLPVGAFERQTGLCPLHAAWTVLDEVSGFLRERMPEDYSAQLARRAEAVFAKHPFWEKKYRSAYGREHLLVSMRHWLAGVLANERPELFHQVPEGSHVDHPLNGSQPARAIPRRKKPRINPPTAFIRQFEFLTA